MVVPGWLSISGPSSRWAVKLSAAAVVDVISVSDIIMMIGVMGPDDSCLFAKRDPKDGVLRAKNLRTLDRKEAVAVEVRENVFGNSSIKMTFFR